MKTLLFDEIFFHKKYNEQKLSAFGFTKDNNLWAWQGEIQNGNFVLNVTFDSNGTFDTNLIERKTGEPYILYKTSAQGAFIGEIREEIRKVLIKIADVCFESCVFKAPQTQRVIDFVRKTYGDELEFLWKNFPDNAIWRRKDTNKWYAAILTVKGLKIGLPTADKVEIIDLRMSPSKSEEILSQPNYLSGWHMNKKSWFTIVLNDSISDEELYCRIKESYELANR